MNRYLLLLIAVVAALAVPWVAFATLPKPSWSNGETVRAVDLNANFQHLEAAAKGGSHTAIVNADISNSAAIAHNKLATPSLVPKLWALVGDTSASCTASPCTLTVSVGVTSVTRSSQGDYVVTFPARANAVFAPMVSLVEWAAGNGVGCNTNTRTTTTFGVKCTDAAGADQDAAFVVMLFDNDT